MIVSLRLILLLTISIFNCAYTNDLRVVIIGAGSAGIAAASKLLQNGFTNVTLLEAESRFGGRVNTIPFGDAFVDLGAQWCHGERGNPVFDMAFPLGLLEVSDQYKQFTYGYGNGDPIDQTMARGQLEMFEKMLYNEEELNAFNGTLAEYVEEKYATALATSNATITPELRDAFKRYFQVYISIDTATENWQDENGPGYLAYAEVEGDQMLNWKGKGYVTALELLMKILPDPTQSLHIEDRINLNAEVNKIEWDREDDTILIRSSDGRQFQADRVIFTPSLGVLKEQHQDIFVPQLSGKKVEAIQGLSIGAIGKVFLLFNESFWPNEWTGLFLLWTDDMLRQLNDNEKWLNGTLCVVPVEHHPKVLSFWIGGPSVGQMEEASDELVVSTLMKFLRNQWPKTNILDPIDMKRSQWKSNRHFRGSYSSRGINATRFNVSPKDLEQPLKNKRGHTVVQFAGEATHFDHYSTVHGAIETGWREADRIIEDYRH